MKRLSLLLLSSALVLAGCSEPEEKAPERVYSLERVGPAQIVQVYADGFERLTVKEKIFCYHLSQAAIAGRDIAIDQHHPRALEVRSIMEQIYTHPAGIDSAAMGKISEYMKLFWINNGFYDNITSKKFVLELSWEQLLDAAGKARQSGASLGDPAAPVADVLAPVRGLILDPAVDPLMTDKSPGVDWIRNSSVNFYQKGLTLKEVEKWAASGKEKNALNSTVVKEKGKLVEKVWRAGGGGVEPGLYAKELESVIGHLEQAIPYASGEYQQETIRLLVKYLRSGDLQDFRKYNIHWVKDSSSIDFILGFIEVYLDPRGQKAEWEASVYYTDPDQTRLMRKLAEFVQYFEDNAPWAAQYKKTIDDVPIANVINVTVETGGTGPVSPIGINLPNEQAIRDDFGSKSVLLQNIVSAYDMSRGASLLKEIAWDQAEVDASTAYGTTASNLHTAMHEVIGHASGRVSPKLEGKDPAAFLPGYYSTLEEARADLVALWNAWDPKLVEIGVAKSPEEARKIGEQMYQQAIRVALSQLRRIGDHDQLEEDHMKNRQLIAHYIMKNTNAVKVEKRDGKTYYRITDYEAMRASVGELLTEVMRIKAEGDLNAARTLIDTYGLKVDTALRDEIQERVRKLDASAYTGFVMPELVAVMDPEAKISDVTVRYPLSMADQMLGWSAASRSGASGQMAGK